MRKPNPIIFDYALKIANAVKEESILIGDDWVADAQGAKNFGIEVIFFDALREDRSEEGIAVIQKLQEIQKFL